jgi:hypothetical protein
LNHVEKIPRWGQSMLPDEGNDLIGRYQKSDCVNKS